MLSCLFNFDPGGEERAQRKQLGSPASTESQPSRRAISEMVKRPIRMSCRVQSEGFTRVLYVRTFRSGWRSIWKMSRPYFDQTARDRSRQLGVLGSPYFAALLLKLSDFTKSKNKTRFLTSFLTTRAG
ncbi:uncharacterized [Tachysurus ichikawai]